jgi:hypothetical protein
VFPLSCYLRKRKLSSLLTFRSVRVNLMIRALVFIGRLFNYSIIVKLAVFRKTSGLK